MTQVQCYNKGCGQKFNPEDNPSEGCTYHPGEPIFHDAYKGWSCCNKRSTDFTTFLNMKGCTKGPHNPNKPVEPEKPKVDPSTRDEVITVEAKLPTMLPRPSYDTPMKRLQVTIAPSLKQAIEKKKKEEVSSAAENKEDVLGAIKVGENCKNNGCKAVYEGEHSNLEMCQSHPGIPIFHEGMKFWSCCNKRTTDFQEFLEQVGCSTGYHCWHKLEGAKETACRYDWHQTGSHVCVSIYAKLSDSASSFVDANPIRLNANIVFGDAQIFKLDIELTGLIDVEQSTVTLAASKVEVKLKKAEPKSWKTLNIERNSDTCDTKPNKTDDEKAAEEELESKVDVIDLSDI
ncbi:cysteine and histidine-rich domain-containing protein morgana-like isoform X1 [Macrobrachium nipponense]|uniref:cysteine and histidine-rich domain-containing protein morgana-like isoform X1 n=2 Tax=Macrobrachium nipponense TaxID=159736 RepID=UPI0030C8CB24